ncbi:DUF4129 domain-containing protein [Kallotenue papyrolyticum]|uniref:DUF4129 domain-containing protein n=1 Tax=Kallotenue papyrolyticum TaxID=1325125 RepID=UPI0004785EA5|nr:DUF4129 domain-containing protein [Kallotenue papyrolyticum]
MLLLNRPVAAQQPPASPEEYERLVRQAYAAASRADRIGLDDVATQLVAIREVHLADGSRVPVDNTWLQKALASEPPDLRMISARLGAILDALGQPTVSPPPDALARLDQILAQPPFADREAPSFWTRFWNAVGQALLDAIEWLLRRVPVPTPGRSAGSVPWSRISPLGALLLALGLLLVLALVIYAVRSVRRTLVRDAHLRAQAAADQERLGAETALDRAQALAQQGDYRSAVRYLYLSALLWLDERKRLRYDRSLTNREVLEQARNDPALYQRLRPVVHTFERVWYGLRPLDSASYRAYQQQVQALREEEREP